MLTRRPAWWWALQLVSALLTVVGAFLIFTGRMTLGAVLLIIAQPINVFLVFRSRAVSTDHLRAQRLPK